MAVATAAVVGAVAAAGGAPAPGAPQASREQRSEGHGRRPVSPAAPAPVIRLDGVSRVYRTGGGELYALREVSLTVARGEMCAIVGPSGSGKSTLMNLLGCLDRPTQGRYVLAGRDVAGLDDDELAEARNRLLGFVFQNYGLLPRLTALENVELPLVYRGLSARQRRAAAEDALRRVGLDDRLDHRPSQLSGGQQQRVAIARAVAGRPEVLLADEPTGNLDSRSGAEVLQLIAELNAGGMTVILVTHDNELAARCPRVVRIRDGAVESDEVRAMGAPAAPAGRMPPVESPVPPSAPARVRAQDSVLRSAVSAPARSAVPAPAAVTARAPARSPAPARSLAPSPSAVPAPAPARSPAPSRSPAPARSLAPSPSAVPAPAPTLSREAGASL